MKSHANPMRLLKQFAYFDQKTKSLRLWRYQRGLSPTGDASPKSETRTDGYFRKPSDPAFEANIEKLLADQVENEVHDFLSSISSPLFVFTERHKRALTRYIALLFTRCPGRKLAVRAHMEETRRRVGVFVDNDEALLKYAIKVSIKEGREVSADSFRRAWKRALSSEDTPESLQEQFAETLDRWKEYFDYHLYGGQWNILHSDDLDPFIIGDNPVVTWKLENGSPSYGVGIQVPGAEIFLPVSPKACLHILPAGHPRPIVSRPTASHVNEAQVMFMTRRVYAQSLLPQIDELVQRKGGALQIGVNCFLPRRDDQADVARILARV